MRNDEQFGRAYLLFEVNGVIFEMMGRFKEGTIEVEYPEPNFYDDRVVRNSGETRVEMSAVIEGNGYRMYTGANPFEPQPSVEATKKEIEK